MKTLAIDGKNVSTLYIDGKRVALGEAPTPTVRGLTFQSLKAFTDDDLNLSASGTITPEFTVKCWSASGASLGSYTFKQEMTTDTRPSLVSLMKESGIDVDSMKVAGSRFEITGVKQWSDGTTYVKFNGQTSQCFQLYGSIDESFKEANSGWTMQYMFQSNPTIAAAGFTYANDDGTSVSMRFAYMFYQNTSIKTCVATDEKDVEHKMSIGGTGAKYCYYMFNGCTSLTTAPELPATTLAIECYYGMFSGCTSLTAAPELPATTLASYCYASMFSGCTSLTTAPELPATTLASYCYARMFTNCLKVSELHYAASVETDATFTGMTGTPWFGATNATVYYDL